MRPSRSHVLFLSASAATLFACVPAAEEVAPRGAAGFVTEPSAATRGESFVTGDGWTVRFETLALSTEITASSPVSYGDFAPYIWNAATPETLYVPAIGVGPARVGIYFRGIYLRDDDLRDEEEILGVAPTVLDRFLRPADGSSDREGSVGPSLVVVASGERNGFRVRLDVAITAMQTGNVDGVIHLVDVVANDVALLRLGIEGEALFDDGDQLTFQGVADADENGDGDGVATAKELSTIRASVYQIDNGGLPAEVPLSQALAIRANSMFDIR